MADDYMKLRQMAMSTCNRLTTFMEQLQFLSETNNHHLPVHPTLRSLESIHSASLSVFKLLQKNMEAPDYIKKEIYERAYRQYIHEVVDPFSAVQDALTKILEQKVTIPEEAN